MSKTAQQDFERYLCVTLRVTRRMLSGSESG